MKKKAVIAMLIMCMAVSAAACGKSSDTEKTTTETTDTKDSEDSEKDSTDTDTKETDSSGENRLVSVKDVSKINNHASQSKIQIISENNLKISEKLTLIYPLGILLLGL